MQVLKLRRKNTFIGGHLFQNISYDYEYFVLRKYSTFLVIKDDKDKEIHVSRNALRRYFILMEY